MFKIEVWVRSVSKVRICDRDLDEFRNLNEAVLVRTSMIFQRHYFQVSRMVADYRVHIQTLFPVWEITQNVCFSNVGPTLHSRTRCWTLVRDVQLSKANMHLVSQRDRVPTEDNSYRNFLHTFPCEKLPHLNNCPPKNVDISPGKIQTCTFPTTSTYPWKIYSSGSWASEPMVCSLILCLPQFVLNSF